MKVQAETIKAVSESYKALSPTEKVYITGVMFGLLTAREHSRVEKPAPAGKGR